MKAGLATICAVLAFSPVKAEAPRQLNDSREICDPEGDFCLRGTLWYRPNSRRLELRARVSRAPGPGWVSVYFRGTSRRNEPGSAIMEFPVRGSYSEIVDRAFIPGRPEIGNWRLERLDFEPDDAAERAARDGR